MIKPIQSFIEKKLRILAQTGTILMVYFLAFLTTLSALLKTWKRFKCFCVQPLNCVL